MTTPDPTIPAIAELIDLGRRFVLWRAVKDRETGKVRKLPLQAATGKAASSTDPATWATWEACHDARRRHRAAGIGVVFNGDGVGGVDLDSCRDPVTGTIADWAMRWIREINSYTEVSPSGSGVKIIFKVDPVPKLVANKRTVGEAGNGGDHAPAVELYVTGRYFALTGQHVDGTPDEITDATPAVERLARWIAEGVGGGPSATADDLPPQLAAAIDADPTLKAAWASGEKLTRGGDGTRSGLEFSLMVYLARSGWTDELLALAIRHYPHGQFRNGALNERNAERRLNKLLRKAAEIRKTSGERADTLAEVETLLARKAGGDPADCVLNAAVVLRHCPAFVGKIRLDEHRLTIVCRDLPWSRRPGWRDWADTDDTLLAMWCQERGIPVKPSTCAAAVAAVAEENGFHPIRAYLGRLPWDGTPRLDRWLITYFGADEGKAGYLAKVGAKWMISAVARIYDPGCDAQHLLVLEGRQGIKKSRGLAALVPDRRHFTDDIAEAGTKDGAQDLSGKWIIELSELSAIRRGAIERVKAYLSRSEDHYRPSYGRRSGNFPRQCVFVGTTNEHAYLHDPSGNRRFWPVAVTKGDVEGIARDRDQLWAEAVHRHHAGEIWHLDEADERLAAEEQAEREEDDVWTDRVLEWAARQREPFTTSAVLSDAIGMPLERQNRGEETRIGIILRRAGYTVQRPRTNGGRVRVYSKPEVGPGDGPEVGPERPNVYKDGPTGPTGPTESSSSKTTNDAPRPGGEGVVGGGGLKRETFTEGVDRVDQMDHPPPWYHDASWSPRFLKVRTHEERLELLRQWVTAAAGRMVNDATAELPELPDGLALRELRRHCKNLGVRVRTVTEVRP
jgi:hypothetical protein